MIDWVSECCDANPMEDMLDMSTLPYGGPSGFCSTCHYNCIFLAIEEDYETEPGDHFDTQEEKRGER